MTEPRQVVVFSEQSSFGWGGPVDYIKTLLDFLLEHNVTVDLVVDGGTTDEFVNKVSSSGVRLVDKANHPLLSLRACAFRLPKPLNYLIEALVTELWLRRNYPQDVTIIASLCSPGRYLLPFGRLGRGVLVFHSDPTGVKHRRARHLFRVLIGRKARIVAVSGFVARQIKEVWGPLKDRRKLSVLLNPYTKDEITSEYNPSLRHYVLMVGSASEEKNPWFWLDVAKNTLAQRVDESLRFRWVGGGHLLESMRRWVEGQGLAHKIELSGYDPYPLPHYGEAKVYLHLSSRDSSPLSAIDAVHAKLPMMVANVGGLPELCEHRRNGLVLSTDDPESVSRALIELVENDELLRTFSEGSSRIYEERLRLQTWKEKMSALIFPEDKEFSPAGSSS